MFLRNGFAFKETETSTFMEKGFVFGVSAGTNEVRIGVRDRYRVKIFQDERFGLNVFIRRMVALALFLRARVFNTSMLEFVGVFTLAAV